MSRAAHINSRDHVHRTAALIESCCVGDGPLPELSRWAYIVCAAAPGSKAQIDGR